MQTKPRTLPFLAALVALAGCGGSGGGSTSDAGGPLAVRSLELRTKQIVYDSARNRIWASVDSPEGSGTSIVAIDPAKGTVVRTIAVGAQPNALAISDDNSTLYVGLDGVGKIRRVNLGTNAAGVAFDLPPGDYFGTPFATDLAVQPGNPDVVAATIDDLGSDPNGLAVFDNGSLLPKLLTNRLMSQIAWRTATDLVAIDATSTTATLSKIAVDESGATLVNQLAYPGEVYANDFVIREGRVYTGSGNVLDAVTLAIEGKFEIPGAFITYGPALDLAKDRAYFVNIASTGETSLHVFDTQTFAEVGSGVALPAITDTDVPSTQGRSNIVRWGRRSLALRTRTKVIFIDNAPGL